MGYGLKEKYDMSEKKLIIIAVVFTLIILGVGIFLVGQSSAPQIASSENTKAVVARADANWGTIPMKGGNVTKTFTIKSAGTEPLKLFNIRTSCHCTKAQVRIGTEESPLFGMDSYSSWIGEVQAGKDAMLIVIFDPLYHGPQGKGPVNRYVSVETNDRSNAKLTFSVTGIVVD